MDVVKKPEHYMVGEIEPIDYIESLDLNFNLGNVIKYISRAGHKRVPKMSLAESKLIDLKKAQQYLNREVERLEKISRGTN